MNALPVHVKTEEKAWLLCTYACAVGRGARGAVSVLSGSEKSKNEDENQIV